MSKLHVACLCAAWCRTCDAYGATLQAVLADFQARGLAHPPRWIDIEDEAELVGDLDIETFPTLLVYDPLQLYFAGPLTPQADTLRRLLDKALDSTHAPMAQAPAFEPLLQRLRAG